MGRKLVMEIEETKKFGKKMYRIKGTNAYITPNEAHLFTLYEDKNVLVEKYNKIREEAVAKATTEAFEKGKKAGYSVGSKEAWTLSAKINLQEDDGLPLDMLRKTYKVTFNTIADIYRKFSFEEAKKLYTDWLTGEYKKRNKVIKRGYVMEHIDDNSDIVIVLSTKADSKYFTGIRNGVVDTFEKENYVHTGKCVDFDSENNFDVD